MEAFGEEPPIGSKNWIFTVNYATYAAMRTLEALITRMYPTWQMVQESPALDKTN